jgi:hypothetical protein
LADFFTDEQNLAELVSHMPEEDRARFLNWGHNRVEPVFLDRVFIVYKPTGLTPSNRHAPPEILNIIKVIDFGVEPRNGAYSVLKEQNTQQEMTLTHVPKRLFSYPIFVSLPAKLTLKWDGRMVNDRVWRSLSFAFLIKTKNKSAFYSKGNVYMETPNQLKKLYPDVTNQFSF